VNLRAGALDTEGIYDKLAHRKVGQWRFRHILGVQLLEATYTCPPSGLGDTQLRLGRSP